VTMQAIETRYAGCRFRSRLEARWAVFFDRLGIRWEYEPQGFVVGWPPGRRYLPDFWLPDLHLWVEVKGAASTLDLQLTVDAAVSHYGLPADPYGGHFDDASRVGPRLLLLGPVPRPGGRAAHSLLGFWKGDVHRDWAEFEPGGYSTHGAQDLIGSDGPDYFPADPNLVNPAYFGGQPSPFVSEAYAAARSARFEHGECG
jgi:hypothetical protein